MSLGILSIKYVTIHQVDVRYCPARYLSYVINNIALRCCSIFIHANHMHPANFFGFPALCVHPSRASVLA